MRDANITAGTGLGLCGGEMGGASALSVRVGYIIIHWQRGSSGPPAANINFSLGLFFSGLLPWQRCPQRPMHSYDKGRERFVLPSKKGRQRMRRRGGIIISRNRRSGLASLIFGAIKFEWSYLNFCERSFSPELWPVSSFLFFLNPRLLGRSIQRRGPGHLPLFSEKELTRSRILQI